MTPSIPRAGLNDKAAARAPGTRLAGMLHGRVDIIIARTVGSIQSLGKKDLDISVSFVVTSQGHYESYVKTKKRKKQGRFD
jgi:hypothetical protein